MAQSSEQQKIQLFEQTPIPKAVMTLAIPTVLSSLVMVLYNLADTYFVGMLGDPIQNAGVTLAAPLLLAFNAVNNLFGVGSSSMMSRALGRKDYEMVRRGAAFGFYCSLVFALLFSIGYAVFSGPILTMLGATEETSGATAGYLFWTVSLGAAPAILNVVLAYLVRSEGSALHASIGTMSGCFLNILLDPLFILPWGLDMGAAGAGFATFISNCVACLYFFVLLYVKRKSTFVSLNPKKFSFDRAIASDVFRVGIPASIQNLLNVTGMTILNNFTASYGSDAVAAMGIAYKLTMIPMQISMGLSQGVMPLYSYTYASANYKRLRKSLMFAARICLIFSVGVTVFYYFGSEQLVRLFMDNAAIVEYGSRFLHGMCLGITFLSIDFMAVGLFQATGKGEKAFVFAILRKIVLEIPALFILKWLFGVYGLAYAQFVAEIVLAAAAVFTVVRMFKGFERNASAN